MLTSALAMFFTVLAICDGEMYPYLFLGVGIGFLSFYCTLGRVCYRFLASIFRVVHRLYRRIYRSLSRFLKHGIALFAEKMKKCFKKLRKIKVFSQKPLEKNT